MPTNFRKADFRTRMIRNKVDIYHHKGVTENAVFSNRQAASASAPTYMRPALLEVQGTDILAVTAGDGNTSL